MSQVAARLPIDTRAAALGFFTVIAANGLYLAGLRHILDPMISMDSYYIELAQQPLAEIVHKDPGWGPLYALWFKPFLALLGDPIAAYTANLYALSLGVSVLIYAYILLLTRQAVPALAAALLFLISDFNVPLCNKVSGFAWLVLLAGWVMAELVPQGTRRATGAATAVLLASYARPELFPAAIALYLITLWGAVRSRSGGGSASLLWPLGGFAVVLVLGLWIGTPLYSPHHQSDRLTMALREHFAWNWARWHQEWPYWLTIWEREFGDAQSLWQALLNNPSSMLHHLADNLRGAIQFLALSSLEHYPLWVPATRPGWVQAESLCMTALAAGSLMLVLIRPALRQTFLQHYGETLTRFVIVSAFSLMAVVAIFPLPNYLLFPSLLWLLSAVLASTMLLPPAPKFSWRVALPAALLCLAAVPRPFVLPSSYAVAGSPFQAEITLSRRNLDLIEHIRSLPLRRPVNILTLSDGVGALLGPDFHEVKMWQKGSQPLPDYLRDNQVAVILKLHEGHDTFNVADPFWEQLQDNPEAAGFKRQPIASHPEVRLYVQEGALP